MTRRLSKSRAVVLIYLLVFATAWSPFLGVDQRNYLVIGLAILAGPLIVALRFQVTTDLFWVGAIILYQALILLTLGTASDMSTIGYTGLFALAYLLFATALTSGHVGRDLLVAIFRTLIFAFAALSVLQMIASFSGLPVPNQILSKGMWSHNALAAEPSHLGRVMAITLLAYLTLRRDPPPGRSVMGLLRREKAVLAAFATTIILSGSALAILAAPFAIMLSLKARWIVVLSGIAVLIWPMLYLVEAEMFQRALGFLTVLPSLDATTIIEADHSAALRVLPLFLYLETVDFTTLTFWFGGGIGAIATLIQGELFGAGDMIAAGFIPGFLIAFGAFGTLLFAYGLIGRFISLRTLPVACLWVLLFANSAWNSQVFWYGLMVFRVVHFYLSTHPAASPRASILTPAHLMQRPA